MPEIHIFAELPENKGIWVFKRDDSATDYRKNGHAATLGDPGRCSRYKTPRRILATLKARNNGKGINPSTSLAPITRHGPEHIARYFFEFVAVYIKGKRLGQSIPNFSRGGTPYGNQAHHLIPQAQFLALFGKREQDMLKRVDYNVHNGRNLIFLPEHLPDCRFHNLPYHHGSHPKYDRQVEKDASILADELRELDDKACNDEALLDIKKRLMALQEDYWELLANSGPVAVNQAVKGKSAK